MTGAEVLTRWTGRMGLRKAKGRRCAHWLQEERCQERDPGRFCVPPGGAHMSVWGLGERFRELRVLCSQPRIGAVTEGELDIWTKRFGMVVWERPDWSWNVPGETTLQVFVPLTRLGVIVRLGSCPGCRATGDWNERQCCGIGDLAAWWDNHRVAHVLMK